MAKTLREKNINQIIYISLGGAIAVIILFIVLFNAFNNKNKNNNIQLGENSNIEQNSSKQAASSVGKKVDELKEYNEVKENETVQVKIEDGKETDNQSDNTSANDNKEIESNLATSSNNNPKVNETENSNIEAFSDEDVNPTNSEAVPTEEIAKDPTFTMPVEGEIVKHFGKDKLIYSETLKEWTTHLGIDIKADKTTIVKASADGVVKSIKNDPRYGLTIVLEHQNGFTSVYSNLLTAEFVVVGENVKTGQTLGTVGNSATFEILDDPHLHFEILKDGGAVDPEMYVK